ncbi:hypothetical protein [Sediminibacterium soli]|uniref:hypothetical protein n=1 Tax=Sediminibacterium soli TaxID=2698829 RepID=UPI00137A2792|nr:hypothetical protein [Sediminibacterium soli]NCI45958.1 hypothetical protein [Sediminibacterium soli]
MRLVDRLQEYLCFHGITAYAFEHSCALSNGYLGKQLRGKGAIGSDILERIKQQYPDLSLVWLVTGKGSMLLSPYATGPERKLLDLNEEQQVYFTSKDDVIGVLNKQIEKLEKTIDDKDRIIQLMEKERKGWRGG